MPYDRKHFYDSVRADLFSGSLSQSQVDGMNYLLAVWEKGFEEANPRDGTQWLAYCLATVFHETAQAMVPVEEYGKGAGHSYGEPCGPYDQVYYGRGHVQLTWEDNYIRGTEAVQSYGLECDLHAEPHRMLEGDISAVVLYDGMVAGWFTGAGLPTYFNSTTEDPVNARRIVNGTDKADLIAGYYWQFKAALKQVEALPPEALEAQLPGLPEYPHMPKPEAA